MLFLSIRRISRTRCFDFMRAEVAYSSNENVPERSPMISIFASSARRGAYKLLHIGKSLIDPPIVILFLRGVEAAWDREAESTASLFLSRDQVMTSANVAPEPI